MREIKFRGKDTESQKWIYGFLINFENSVTEICYEYDEVWEDNNCVIVDSETVGQYTGLKDNNGKEIYEGDIVKVLVDDEDIAVIEYDSEDAAFIVKYRDIGYIITFSDIWGKDVEVIGNIHDNPELLIGDDE